MSGLARVTLNEVYKNHAEKRELVVDKAFDFLNSLPAEIEFEEAGPFLRSLELQDEIDSIRKHLRRFIAGETTRRIRGFTSHGDILSMYTKLAHDFQINANTLRYYVAVAEIYQGNIRLFDRWLRIGPTKTMQHIKTLTRSNIDVTVRTPEEVSESIVRQVENLSERVSKIVGHEQRESAVLLLTEAATDFRDKGIQRLHEMAEDRRKRVEPPEEFKQMVGQLNCMACGAPPPPDGANDPHHVEQGGWALKGSDWTQIPLCRRCHNDAESMSPVAFFQRYGIDPNVCVARVLHFWCAREDFQPILFR